MEIDMVEEIEQGCTMNKKMLSECQGSGGCCQNTNCLFGGCNDDVPTPAPLSKTDKKGHHKNGDVLGNIVGEDQNLRQGFGDNKKDPIVRTHMPGAVNWARLWGAEKKKHDDIVDDNMRMPSDPYDKEMPGQLDAPMAKPGQGSAFDATLLMSKANRPVVVPTKAPTKDYWEKTVSGDANRAQHKSDTDMKKEGYFDQSDYNAAKARYQQLGAAVKRSSTDVNEALSIAEKEHVKGALKMLGTHEGAGKGPAMHKDKFGNMVLGGAR
jgi:hypothetical protein